MRFGIFVVMAGRKAGGPESYEHNLIRSLASIDKHNEYHIFCLNKSAEKSFHLTQENLIYHILKPHIRWLSIPISLPIQTLRSKLDILHVTFTPPPFSPIDYVFTMHCASTFVHPEFYSQTILWRLNKLIIRGMEKARLIICVSENVRDFIAEKFKIPSERLAVVYHGVGENYRPINLTHTTHVLKNTYGIHDPYILYVGKIQARKNIISLIEAFHRFRQEVKSEVKLVLAGLKTWTSEGIDETIDRLKLRDHIIELGYVPHQDLPILYSGAKLFAFPSLWEGFGIPVIEAMACGTPVVTSNISCLPEVAGGASVLVNPYSIEDIAEALFNVYNDDELRATLRAEGLERASQFTWEQTARQTIEAYKKATM